MSDDTLAAAAKLSKVSTINKLPWLHTIWIISIVLFIIAAMFFDSHTKHTLQGGIDNTVMMPQHDDTILADNLARLRHINQQIHTQHLLFNLTEHEHTTKQYLARQNAPTNMYSAPETISSLIQSTDDDTTRQTTPIAQSAIAFSNHPPSIPTMDAQQIAHPQFTVASGEFMHAVLETAIDSTLPGHIRALVSQPIYAFVGDKPLIPAGSRLLGQYTTATWQGQNRVFIIWDRIILPNGITAQLNSPSVDHIGQAGQGADNINTHFLTRFGEASLLSIIAAGTANIPMQPNDQATPAAQYRTSIAQAFQQTANESLQHTLATQPTLQVFPGARINVFVAHDIDFYTLSHVNNTV